MAPRVSLIFKEIEDMNKLTRYLAISLLSILLAAFPALTLADQFQVSNLDDTGPGSLRQAIIDANALPGPHLIEFQSDLAGTVLLGSPLPELDESMDILGPVSGLVTIDGNGLHQPFLIEEGAVVSMTHLTLRNGQSLLGGAIVNFGELTLEHMLIANNSAEFGGGGISNEGLLVIRNSTISGNSTDASGIGGGLENFNGNVLIVDSLVTGNSADFGGGVDNFGQLEIRRSTFSNNQGGFGGAIGNTDQLLIVNSTLSGNSSDSGGGIDNFDGQLELLHVTIAGNSADSGGGIWSNVAFTAKNSLVAASPDGGDCELDPAAPPQVLGANLDTDGSCTGFQTTTVAALDLHALADNGGPTMTHALGSASAALEAAADCTELDGSTPVSEDQRGVERPQGQACDIGAFELESEDQEDLIFADRFQ
jgi:hypothetical protein